jgi:hypothetical protein
MKPELFDAAIEAGIFPMSGKRSKAYVRAYNTECLRMLRQGHEEFLPDAIDMVQSTDDGASDAAKCSLRKFIASLQTRDKLDSEDLKQLVAARVFSDL